MKITARQLKEQDTIANTLGVVSAVLDKAANVMRCEFITAGGVRHLGTYAPNKILVVDRAEVDGTDPLARPYWWGLEAEQERAEDRRQYEHEMMLEAAGVWI